MSILDGLQKTEEEKVYEKILNNTPNIVEGEKNRCLSMFTDLWGNVETPRPLSSCQIILDKFGDEAYQLFDIHHKWQTFITSVDLTYEPLIPPYSYYINEDGTVTLSESPSS